MTSNDSDSRRSDAVLVAGAGIGGMQSALLLAEAGHQVYLLDPGPGIGGSMHLLDRTFPTDSCGICHMLPGRAAYCPTIECDLHQNIQIVPYAEVVGMGGQPGAFRVQVRHKPRYVSVERCNNCARCVEVCPAERPSPYEGDLARQKAIYRPPLRAVPAAYVIDMEACTRCGRCVEVCPTGAVDLDAQPSESWLEAGAVILSPGFAFFDAGLKGEYGFGYHDNVLTSIQFERMISLAGSTGAHIVRPSDGKPPGRIAVIQCVGSRDVSIDRGYCSSVCCMYTAKQVKVAKALDPDLRVDVFYMDIRAHGKDFDAYFEGVEGLPGVTYRRSMVSSVHQLQQSRNLLLTCIAEDGSLQEEEFDLVVLAVGLGPPEGVGALGRAVGVELNQHGFAASDLFAPVESSRPGVFVSGSFREPKDIPETVVEACAAAASAARLLRSGRTVAGDASAQAPAEERDVSEEWPRVGVFFCDDGQLAAEIDLQELVEHARSLPGVGLATIVDRGFAPEGLQAVAADIKRESLNRIVLAGRPELRLSSAFDQMMREVGLNANLLEVLNLGAELGLLSSGNGRVSTDTARELVAMAVAGAARRQPCQPVDEPLVQRVLVIGGGLAGLTAALNLAEMGHPVDLVEQSDALGGQLRHLRVVLGDANPEEALSSLIERVGAQPRIRVLLQTEVAAVDGRLGQFQATLAPHDGEPEEVEYGAVVVATGGREVVPTEYGYGENRRVVTQRELERILADGGDLPKDVVMIQCVESREPQRPYCSRICCTKAIVNALAVKERDPETRVTVLYREVRAYGFREEAYRQAREKGVVFLRYDVDRKPEVVADGDGLRVRLTEPVAGQEVTLEAGLLVLSTGIDPGDNEVLARTLGVELDANGFFREEHPKMRPLDFGQRGIFVCGLAHSPRAADETIAMAAGAAMRVVSLLSRGRAEAPRTVAQVVTRLCSACGLCVEACPYGARVLEPGGPHAEVVATLCQGCGVCVAVCPNGASQQAGFGLQRVYDMLDVAAPSRA